LNDNDPQPRQSWPPLSYLSVGASSGIRLIKLPDKLAGGTPNFEDFANSIPSLFKAAQEQREAAQEAAKNKPKKIANNKPKALHLSI